MKVNLKRFDYDWERDCRCKIDGCVTFPFEINMATFLEGEVAPEPVSFQWKNPDFLSRILISFRRILVFY